MPSLETYKLFFSALHNNPNKYDIASICYDSSAMSEIATATPSIPEIYNNV